MTSPFVRALIVVALILAILVLLEALGVHIVIN